MAKKRILVIFGGPSDEYDVSLASAKNVYQTLDRSEYDVTLIGINRQGQWQLGQSAEYLLTSPAKTHTLVKADRGNNQLAAVYTSTATLKAADLVFLALHGQVGEDGTLQGLLDAAGIAYTGSGPLASATCFSKRHAMALVREAGIAVPNHQYHPASEPNLKITLPLPFVILPNASGSSIGVHVCQSQADVRKAQQDGQNQSGGLLISEYIAGTEVTVSILGQSVLGVTEIVPNMNTFYDYASKYETGGSKHITPARLPAAVLQKTAAAALKAFQVLGCRDYARLDFIVRGSTPYFLEANTLPGLTDTSLLPDAAAAHGLAYPALLNEIIKLAQQRTP